MPSKPCRRVPTLAAGFSICLAWVSAASPIVLNEYNAVSDTRFLGADDASGTPGSDVFFGRVAGNGGDWFELVIAEDLLDFRGFTFEWSFHQDAANHGSGLLRVEPHPGLSQLRAGTVVTVIERPASLGGADTDLATNPGAGDWWINLCSSDASVLTTTGAVLENGANQLLADGVFRVNNDQWTLTIRDSTGAVVFGPAGEGAADWTGPGISSTEVGQLRAEPSFLILPSSSYSDGIQSTFGQPNVWNSGLSIQSFLALRAGNPVQFRIRPLEPLAGAAGWRITWNSGAGLHYLLQGSDATGTTPSWTDLTMVEARESSASAVDSPAASVPMRLYRIRQPASPPTNGAILISPPSGEYPGTFEALLSTTASGGVVRFTTDGREPALGDPVWTAPLTVAGPTLLRTAYFQNGHLPGLQQSRFWLTTNRHALPVLALATSPSNLFDPLNGIYLFPNPEGQFWERPAQLLAGADGLFPEVQTDIGIEIAGGASRDNPKKSIALKWRRRFGDPAFETALFSERPGVRGFTDLVLRAGGTDSTVPRWSLIRDPLVQALGSEIRLPVSATEFVHLYLNESYWGVYTLRERIESDYLLRNYGVNAADLVKFEDETPVPISGDLRAWGELSEFASTNDFTTVEGLALAGARIDLTNYTDYQLLHIYAGNMDWPHNNVFAWRERSPEGLWRWILWDVDLSFNLPWWTDANGLPFNQASHDTLAWAARATPRIDLAPPWLAAPDGREASGSLLWSTLLLHQLLSNPDYQTRFILRAADLLNSTLSTEHVLSTIDRLAAQVAGEIPDEVARWGKEQSYPGQWNDNIELLRLFAGERPARLRNFLRDAFQLGPDATIRLEQVGGDGFIRIGSLTPPAPTWTGIYFQGVPVEVEAFPAPGYQFLHWDLPNPPAANPLSWLPTESNVTLRAVFAPL